MELIKRKLDAVEQLLADPQPGLFEWRQSLDRAMNELIDAWLAL